MWIVLQVCAGLLALLSYIAITRLGFGQRLPLNPSFEEPPLLPPSALKIVATLPLPPGNIAVNKIGRVFFNFHPEYNTNPIKVVELDSQDTWHAFPDEQFQSKIVSCLSLRIDNQNRLWLLDFAHHGLGGIPSLFGFQLSDSPGGEDSLVVHYEFPADVAGVGSMLNDFVIDPSGLFIYIVDTSIVSSHSIRSGPASGYQSPLHPQLSVRAVSVPRGGRCSHWAGPSRIEDKCGQCCSGSERKLLVFWRSDERPFVLRVHEPSAEPGDAGSHGRRCLRQVSCGAAFTRLCRGLFSQANYRWLDV